MCKALGQTVAPANLLDRLRLMGILPWRGCGETLQVFAVGQDENDEDSDDINMSGTPGSARGRAGGRIREASVGAQFKQSLAGLIATISSTQPR